MALAGIIFAIGLQRGVESGRFWTKIGPALLVEVGIAMLLSGFPIEDVHYGAPHSFQGWIHLLAFYLFLASSTLACFFMWLRLREDSLWRGYDWYSLGTGVLAVLLFQFTMFYIVLAVLLTWLEVLATRLWVITRREGASGA